MFLFNFMLVWPALETAIGVVNKGRHVDVKKLCINDKD